MDNKRTHGNCRNKAECLMGGSCNPEIKGIPS